MGMVRLATHHLGMRRYITYWEKVTAGQQHT